MGGSLRKSGIDIIGDMPWGTHFCQFYQTREDLIEILVPFFKAGLENNELCVWIISQPLEVVEAKEALRKGFPDIDVYLEKGQIEIIPCAHGHINEDVFGSEKAIISRVKKLDQVLACGYDGLRITEGTQLLKKGVWADFVDYEKKVDTNLGERCTISLFPYFLGMCSAADIIEVACSHQFVLIKKDGKWERIENTGWKHSPVQIQAKETPFQEGRHIDLKLENSVAPFQERASLELADIIDVQAIQSLMDDFYEFAHITISIVDLKGNVLVSIGWQDICIRFHRVHPETCKHCVESDTKLSARVLPGEFKWYRCRNNMWDTATPIRVGDQHVGNIFSGQFFFEDEPLDYELFRSQARKYGFNEEEYIAALEKVPRLSSEVVATGMAFFAKLANMLSQLSYSNIKLSQSLAERDSLVAALRESDERFRSVLENSLDSAYRMDLRKGFFDYMSPVIEQITGFSPKEINAMSISDYLDRIHPDDRQPIIAGSAKSLDDGFGAHEYRFKCKDGKYRWLADHFSIIKDKTGMFRFRAGIARDITERKKAEEALRLSNIYNRSLIEASLDPSVTIGRDGKIKDVNGATEQVTGYSTNDLIGTDFSDYFTEPEKARTGYQQVFIDGKVRDYPLEIQHKDGQITPVLYNASVYRDENGEIIGVFAAARDITESKKAEEALKKAHDNLEKIVEERTAELEKAYNSLKESENGLAEAQKMAHIGNWEWDIAANKACWSDELYRIYGCNPQESGATYDELFNYVHPDDRDYVANAIKALLKGKPYGGIDYRMILANGEERIVHAKGEVVFDEKNPYSN